MEVDILTVYYGMSVNRSINILHYVRLTVLCAYLL